MPSLVQSRVIKGAVHQPYTGAQKVHQIIQKYIVDHPIMLQVLHDRFCVKDMALKWFKSYLSDRTQTYQVKNQQSRPRTVDCSVPQGSVLGPPNSTLILKIWQTSLTTIIWSHHDVCGRHSTYRVYNGFWHSECHHETPELCPQSIHQWCRSRRLQLNPAKTELILVRI